MLYTVRGLEDRVKGVNIRLRVLKKEKPRTVKTKDGFDHEVVDVLVGDITGTVIMTLWDDLINKVQQGELIDVQKGYVTRFKGRLRLNIGKYGLIEKIEENTFPSIAQLLRRKRIIKKSGKSSS